MNGSTHSAQASRRRQAQAARDAMGAEQEVLLLLEDSRLPWLISLSTVTIQNRRVEPSFAGG